MVVLAKKWPLQRRHFPCEFRAHPYLFGIRRARGMGLDRVLIQNVCMNNPSTHVVYLLWWSEGY